MRSTSLRSLLAALAIMAAPTLAIPVMADDVAMPAQSGAAATTTPVTTPARGITMAKVEAQFGAPTERHAAIGKPPITRWDYANFSVFFEYDHVVHAVVH
jgi:hypothetical protein